MERNARNSSVRIMAIAIGLLLTLVIAVAVLSKLADPVTVDSADQNQADVVVLVPTESGLGAATQFPRTESLGLPSHSNGRATLDWSLWGGRTIELPYEYASLLGDDDAPSGSAVEFFCLQSAGRESAVTWLDSQLPDLAALVVELGDQVLLQKLPVDGESVLASIERDAVFIDHPADSVHQYYGFLAAGSGVEIELEIAVTAWGYGSSRGYSVRATIWETSKWKRRQPNWSR